MFVGLRQIYSSDNARSRFFSAISHRNNNVLYQNMQILEENNTINKNLFLKLKHQT